MTLIYRSEGSGPDLVMLHGWGLNSTAFDSVLPLLTPFLRVHLVDLPGYGDNRDQDPAALTLEGTLDALDGIVPPGAHVLGWSLGGLVAMAFAVRRAGDLGSYITVCSSPRFCEELDDMDEHHQIWPGVEHRILKAFTRLLRPQNKDEVCDHFLAMQALGSPSIRHDIRSLRQALAARPKPSYEALKAGLELLDHIDLRHDCSELSLPSLHIFGDADRIVSPDVSTFWDRVPSARVEIFSRTAHNPFISSPVRFADSLKSFILPAF